MSGGKYIDIFTKPGYKGFDEQRSNVLIPNISHKNFFSRKLNVVLHIMLHKILKTDLMMVIQKNLRNSHGGSAHRKSEQSDFNRIIRKAGMSGDIRIKYRTIYLDDIMLKKTGLKHWTIEWKNGKLFYNNGEQSYFHFQYSKLFHRFKIMPYVDTIDAFYISKNGIHRRGE